MFPQDSLPSRLRVSIRTPPRLLELAGRSLLRNDALAVAALECLPTEQFPPLFMEAFCGRHRASLKALVHAWPLARLPLGGPMQMPPYEILQATLNGLDVLLAQKVCPRRWKLQVLDLRNTSQNFWSVWSGARAQVHSRMGPEAEDGCSMQRPLAPLKVFIDLCFSDWIQDWFITYLIWWAKQREGFLHLCCQTLKIFAVPLENIQKVLGMVQLDWIREVEVNCTWNLSTLGMFAPYLGQMSNVQRLFLSHIHVSASEEEEQQVSRFTCQLLRLRPLRKLHMESPSFLEGRLDPMLRCLQTPLETLSITNCLLTESDLKHLSQCPNLGQFKDLDLSGVTLTDFSPEPLRALLERVAASLQDLDVIHCGITDSQVEAILPVLSRCCQLRTFGICGNVLSMATVEKLLRHTAGLSSLSLEL